MKLVKDKPAEPATYDERLRALAKEQGWPSVSLDAGGGVVGDGLPDGLPALPTITKAPPLVDAARALAGELAEACAQLEADEAAAVEAGDADAIIATRNAKEEAIIRAWAAQRDAAVAELDWYESEHQRIAGCAGTYAGPLDEVREQIRRLQEDEAALVGALGIIHHQMDRCVSVTGRLEEELEGLRRGPSAFALVAAKKGRWS